jgi:hypothetical protein
MPNTFFTLSLSLYTTSYPKYNFRINLAYVIYYDCCYTELISVLFRVRNPKMN